MKKLAILCAAAAVLAAPVAMADSHKSGDKGAHHKGGMFEKHDTNSDGMISKSEFMAAHEAKFVKMDVNGDGNISKDEAKSAHKKKRQKMKEKMKDKRVKGDVPSVMEKPEMIKSAQ